jgi:hypothetical protein
MRPETPLAVENGVGKLAASARTRLMSAWEREHGELPAPNLPSFSRKTGRGLFVFLAADFSAHNLNRNLNPNLSPAD